MKITVIGQGYVGTSVGLAAHNYGHSVLGVDTDKKKVLNLRNIGYAVTSDYAEIGDPDIVVLAVPTPLDEEFLPDLSFLKSACLSLKNILSKRTLIINESTSYPGTVRNTISQILGPNHLYAAAPERVDPANTIWKISNTPRVIGGLTNHAGRLAQDFYETFVETTYIVSSPEVAEASKLFENSFRQVNIALVNEFTRIASALKIPVYETIDAAATKPFGFMKFLPSVGVGGHCIPIDPLYLSYVSQMAGVESELINLADRINSQMPEFTATLLRNKFDLKGIKIQLIGIAYKADVEDLRESPALELMIRLRNLGADVIWHDPLVGSYADEVSSDIHEVDLAIVCAPHKTIDFEKLLRTNSIKLNVSTKQIPGIQNLF